jgi:Tfp pilus assembly protein PilX
VVQARGPCPRSRAEGPLGAAPVTLRDAGSAMIIAICVVLVATLIGVVAMSETLNGSYSSAVTSKGVQVVAAGRAGEDAVIASVESAVQTDDSYIQSGTGTSAPITCLSLGQASSFNGNIANSSGAGDAAVQAWYTAWYATSGTSEATAISDLGQTISTGTFTAGQCATTATTIMSEANFASQTETWWLAVKVTGATSSTVYNTAKSSVAVLKFTQSVPSLPCAACLGKKTGDDLDLTSSGSFTVTGGNIYDNSSSSPAASISSSGNVTAPTTDVVGTTQTSSSGKFSPTATTGVPQVASFLTMPAAPSLTGNATGGYVYSCPSTSCPAFPTGTTTYSSITLSSSGSASLPAGNYVIGSITVGSSGSLTLGAGNYVIGSISVSSSGHLNMGAGEYVIDGSFTVSSSGSVNAPGVLLYFTCAGSLGVPTACAAPGSAGGGLSLTSSGNVTITPPTSGTYAGITIYQDPNDDTTLNLSSSGSLTVSGTLYAPDAPLTDSSSGSVETLQSVIDVASVALSSSGGLNVDYNASDDYTGEAVQTVQPLEVT